MKKYSFRLQTVLEMREKTLEDKRREMASVIKFLNDQNDKLDKLVSKTESAKANLERIYESGQELDILEITNYKNFIGSVTNDSKNQQEIINNTKNFLKVKQLDVSKALKEVKILEKLKEKQEIKFYKNYEQVQAKEIDDISSTRYKRVLV